MLSTPLLSMPNCPALSPEAMLKDSCELEPGGEGRRRENVTSSHWPRYKCFWSHFLWKRGLYDRTACSASLSLFLNPPANFSQVSQWSRSLWNNYFLTRVEEREGRMLTGAAAEGTASRAHLCISFSRSCTVATCNFSPSTMVGDKGFEGFSFRNQDSIVLLLTEQLFSSVLPSSTKQHYY